MKTKNRLLLLLVISMLAGVSWILYYAVRPIPLQHTPFEFTLKQGSSLKSAAHQIAQSTGLQHEWLFVLLARGMGMSTQIKPGIYLLKAEASPLELLDMISSGRVEHTQITIIEGSTFNELRKLLDVNAALLHDSVKLTDAEILKQIGASEDSAEGLFFPDTYDFESGTSDLAVFKRAYQTMKMHLNESWKNRDAGLPLSTPYQALILASIVEKETGQPEDRPMIASVFINRLRKNMRLQTDPTVIYGMGTRFDGNLRKRDLTTDTPYNTYTRGGLTPTPIALPGLASIQATLHPAQSNALYFVARGDGSSHFSSSLNEHNNAVTRYQLK